MIGAFSVLIAYALGAWLVHSARNAGTQTSQLQAQAKFVALSADEAKAFHARAEIANIYQPVVYEKPEQEAISAEVRQAVVNDHKDMCLGAMIEGEARDEPVKGQYMAGYVGHIRAVDKWFGSDNVCFQVCKRKGKHREFDGTKKFCARLESVYRNGGQWPTVPEKFLSMAREIRTGAYQPPEECRTARYFLNPAYSSLGGIKDFAKNRKFRCVFGDHLFAEDRPKVRKVYAKVKHHRRAKHVLEASASTAPRHKKLAAR
jgi:hypothetical protein